MPKKNKKSVQHINNQENKFLVTILAAVVVMAIFACYMLYAQKEMLSNQTSILEEQYNQQNTQIQQLQDQVKMMESQNAPTGTPMMR